MGKCPLCTPTIPSKAPKASNDAQWIAGLWDRGMDVHGTIAEAYLYHRGIGGTLPDSLRFLPSMLHKPSGTYLALAY